MEIPAAIGKNGLIPADQKREGDGKTPRGRFPMRALFWRPDRVSLPRHHFSPQAITKEMGWCDDPAAPQYNSLVKLPFAASHEDMWRQDHAYDVIIPLGYNDDPAIPHRGSAIFFHILHDGRHVTEGCIAISAEHMLALIPLISPATSVEINP
ncbi:MAG: L,D-transpeptidase family protein [Alphaproteobacteria bacterium]|nr:L,D-transpeptidase family protein [Alphaproteobacteria bacterium]